LLYLSFPLRGIKLESASVRALSTICDGQDEVLRWASLGANVRWKLEGDVNVGKKERRKEGRGRKEGRKEEREAGRKG
jgi:hypothetical protein